MSDIAVAVQQISKSGLTPTQTGSLSAANTYQFPNDGQIFIRVVNGGGSPDTVTIVTNREEDGLALADRTVSVPAGETRMIGPFVPAIYNDGDELVSFTHSFITSVTHAVLHI